VTFKLGSMSYVFTGPVGGDWEYVQYRDDVFVDAPVWQEWLLRHSIDPNEVCVPGWIRRDLTRYRVEYLSYKRNERGKFYAVDDEVVTEARYVQLEGPPMRFPQHEKPDAVPSATYARVPPEPDLMDELMRISQPPDGGNT